MWEGCELGSRAACVSEHRLTGGLLRAFALGVDAPMAGAPEIPLLEPMVCSRHPPGLSTLMLLPQSQEDTGCSSLSLACPCRGACDMQGSR